MSYTKQGDFVRVVKGRIGISSLADRLTFAVSTDNTARETHPAREHRRYTIRLTPDLLRELEWAATTYVEALEGTGRSAGKLLLVPTQNKAVGYKLSINREGKRERGEGEYNCIIAITVNMLRHHTCIVDGHPSVPVSHRVFNNELLLDMPTQMVVPTSTTPRLVSDDTSTGQRRGKSR